MYCLICVTLLISYYSISSAQYASISNSRQKRFGSNLNKNQNQNHHHIPGKNLTVQNVPKERSALFSDSRIVYPLEHILNPRISKKSSDHGLSYSQPLFADGYYSSKQPRCAKNGMYCNYDSTYPRAQVDLLVNRYYTDVRSMYRSLKRIPADDLRYHDNENIAFKDAGRFVCDSEISYIKPGWARNVRGEWKAIINTEEFPQTIRVEECTSPLRKCDFLPPCYKSHCIQRNSFDKLLCVDPSRSGGEPHIDVFQIPSACTCFVEDFRFY